MFSGIGTMPFSSTIDRCSDQEEDLPLCFRSSSESLPLSNEESLSELVPRIASTPNLSFFRGGNIFVCVSILAPVFEEGETSAFSVCVELRFIFWLLWPVFVNSGNKYDDWRHAASIIIFYVYVFVRQSIKILISSISWANAGSHRLPFYSHQCPIIVEREREKAKEEKTTVNDDEHRPFRTLAGENAVLFSLLVFFSSLLFLLYLSTGYVYRCMLKRLGTQ